MTAFGSGSLSIGICDRCQRKVPYKDLRADGNSPGLRVCKDDWDPIDPWRLPPIQPDAISLRHPRPDIPITMAAYTNLILETEAGEQLITEDGQVIITEDAL